VFFTSHLYITSHLLADILSSRSVSSHLGNNGISGHGLTDVNTLCVNRFSSQDSGADDTTLTVVLSSKRFRFQDSGTDNVRLSMVALSEDGLSILVLGKDGLNSLSLSENWSFTDNVTTDNLSSLELVSKGSGIWVSDNLADSVEVAVSVISASVKSTYGASHNLTSNKLSSLAVGVIEVLGSSGL